MPWRSRERVPGVSRRQVLAPRRGRRGRLQLPKQLEQPPERKVRERVHLRLWLLQGVQRDVPSRRLVLPAVPGGGVLLQQHQPDMPRVRDVFRGGHELPGLLLQPRFQERHDREERDQFLRGLPCQLLLHGKRSCRGVRGQRALAHPVAGVFAVLLRSGLQGGQ